LTKETNLSISDRLPEEYFPEIEASHPGALVSQWIPLDSHLWKIKNYREFLEVRKSLLASETNRRMEDLLHGDVRWLGGPAPVTPVAVPDLGGIKSTAEEAELESLNEWVASQGLPRGVMDYEFVDRSTGAHRSVFDLAWPNGIQENLSQPVAVLLNESGETLALASTNRFRCFTNCDDFKRYVRTEILSMDLAA
jgi:hypothetical protein